MTLDGHRLACDVMVTASPTPWQPHDDHLQRSGAAKATRYNATAGGLLHDGARLLPLVHDAHNHWLGAEALALLHLVHAQASHNAPASPQSWNQHLQDVGALEAAHLLHTAVVTSWTMHAASGRMSY